MLSYSRSEGEMRLIGLLLAAALVLFLTWMALGGSTGEMMSTGDSESEAAVEEEGVSDPREDGAGEVNENLDQMRDDVQDKADQRADDLEEKVDEAGGR